MIDKKDIQIKVNHANRRKYEDLLNTPLKNGDYINIAQKDLLKTSRVKVECTCDNCGNTFTRQRVDIKGDTTLCNNSCRNEFLKKNNPNPTKDKIKVSCSFCKKDFEVNKAKFLKQDKFLCSRECYSQHRSENYKSENIYNFQNTFTKCMTCNKEVKTSKWYLENKNNIFCTQQCYWSHRRKFYKEFYYNKSARNSSKETQPERKVRKWLEGIGMVKGKDFFQELGFIRKYYVDFYIPEYKMIIEVYGDYWHVNPEVYDIHGDDDNKKPLHKNQKKLINSQYDEIRINELKSNGFKVHILWEKDINEDLESIMKNILSVKK